MANYQLGPVIGKIGGTDVEINPVSVTTSESRAYDLHTVEIPAGETRLVMVSGQMHKSQALENSSPYLQIGGIDGAIIRSSPGRVVGMAAEVSGTVTVRLVSQSAMSTEFSGHVYVVPLPN